MSLISFRLSRIINTLLFVLLLTCLNFSQSVTYDKRAAGLFARMLEEPHDTMKTHISALIKGLVDSSLWDKFDCFYVMAASDTNKAKLNWIKNEHNLLPAGNMSFEEFRGYMGDGVTGYLETSFNPLHQGINYTLNSCGAGIYSRTNTYALGDRADMGSGERSIYIWINFKGTEHGLMRLFLNSAFSSGSFYNYQGSTLGIITVNRMSRDTVNIYTTTTTGTTTRTSSSKASSIPDYTVFISARNDGKKGTAFQQRQYAAAFIGAPLTESQHNYLTLLLEIYLDAVGAGVLP